MSQLKSSTAAAPPWRTPVLISKDVLHRPLTCTQLSVPLWSRSKRLQYFAGSPFIFSTSQSDCRSIESKAALKSTKATYALCWNYRLFSTSWRIVNICSMVDLPGIKPTCWIFRWPLRKVVQQSKRVIAKSIPGTERSVMPR